MRSINRLRQKRGRLNLAIAIARSRRVFASSRKDSANVLLVITAGKNRGRRLRSQALAVQRAGVTIITVGVIPVVDQTDLTIISSPPAGGNRVVINFIGLMNVIAIVVNKITLGMFTFSIT
jgi:hypothetical protein